MAWKANLQTNGQMTAAADMSTHQYKAVKLTGDQLFNLAGVGEATFGILQNKPLAGQAGNIATGGQTKAVAGGTIAAGADVTVGANGVIVAVVTAGRVNTSDAGSSTDPVIGPNVLGVALHPAVVGDIFTIDIQRRGVSPGTVTA